MISSIKHKQSISWTFLNDAMAFSAKEMSKNHTDKERFAAALSCIQTGILTLLLPLKRRRSSPSPFISHRVLEAVASWILKSLQWTSKVSRHLAVKFDFRASWTYFSPFPPKQCWYLAIIEWGWVGYEEFCRSRRVLSTEAEGRGGLHSPRSAEFFISYKSRIQ